MTFNNEVLKIYLSSMLDVEFNIIHYTVDYIPGFTMVVIEMPLSNYWNTHYINNNDILSFFRDNKISDLFNI